MRRAAWPITCTLPKRLPGRVFQVAETLLDPAAGWIPAGEEEVEHDASLS